MSRYAVISDIHGNLHAFQSVLARLSNMAIDEIVCLGDIVGYGPYPDSCLDLVIGHCSIIVQGNHDEAVIDPNMADMFNGAARAAVHWTRDVLGALHMDAINRLKKVAYIGEQVMCIHDSPAPGPSDYVHDPYIAAVAFRGVEVPICMIGHTHVPMVFEAPSLDAEQELEAHDLKVYQPTDGDPVVIKPDCRYICNPGAVGQPRDSDPRAAFAILDLNEMTFTVHRQEYDINAAQEATQRAGLPTILAERLAIGA